MAELLSPAGGWDSLVAAVQSGADAVYMGFGAYNARRSAKNFTEEEFAQAVRYCHLRGVRVYLTLNTLLTDRELPGAAELLHKASRLGADAVLIQDWGVWQLARQAAPELPLHASTQMSLHTLGGARRAAELGLTRVVLARELSRRDIAAICRDCPAEVEVFAHGALCMCYSGQCALSAVIGGRSGNRGTCAQPCRLPYGVNAPAAGGHPLSLKDANLSPYLQELEDMGVACLKLEGRMKRPEYVAVITSIYRRLLDEKRRPTREEQRQLELAFSRSGFTDGYYLGRKGPQMFGTRPENVPEPKELFAEARTLYEKEDRRTVAVDMDCVCRAGEPVRLTVRAGDQRAEVTGPVPETARNRALTAEELQARLKKTGGTAFRCREVRVTLEEGLMLSAGAVNALRREGLTALEEVLCAVPERHTAQPEPLPDAPVEPVQPLLTCSLQKPEQLTQALQKQEKAARQAARTLSECRHTAAKELEERISRELRELDMPKLRFSIDFQEKELSEDGADAVEFLMSANVGETLRPIQKIASGGELSRIMLALKNVLAEQDSVMTMVFDEVDTGVSGRAAQRVAEKLAKLSRTRQVLCVTHLPQLAAMADTHFGVEKGEENGRTLTKVVSLDRAARRSEIARLSGGDHPSETMIAGAEELLCAAEQYKNQLL